MLVWGWVLASILTSCVGLALSELSSAFPVSGGLYFWAFMLGQRIGPFASWCVGWTNILGQVSPLRSCEVLTLLTVLQLLLLQVLMSKVQVFDPSVTRKNVLQIALVAADTFSCVQLFLAFLYLACKTFLGTGYYPGNYLVSVCHVICHLLGHM